MSEKIFYGLTILIAVALFGICGWGLFTYSGRATVNTYAYNLKKVDESTKYENLKKVEDTCRSMISSYESDKLVYEQYVNSDSEEERRWGEQAKMRANKTASTYNNYILENSFLWEDNVPADIKEELEIIKD